MSVFDKLAPIQGVSWAWNDEAGPLGKVPGARDAGVIAQDVEAVLPALVTTTADGHKQVNYTGLVGIVIEAVKELKARNDALEARVSQLERVLAQRAEPSSAG